MTFCRTIHEQLLYSYHLHRVQGLSPDDYPPQDNFCGACLFSKPLIHCLPHQCSSQMRQLLVQMALKINTTNISGQSSIHVVSCVLDTSGSPWLMCGLVLRVTDFLLVHMLCYNLQTEISSYFPYAIAGNYTFGSKILVSARRHILADLSEM